MEYGHPFVLSPLVSQILGAVLALAMYYLPVVNNSSSKLLF